MSPLAAVLNIAIVVGIVGIIVYWVRRFAVFRGYKPIQADILQIAELLGRQPEREGSDVTACGLYGGFPTFVRFSHRVDRPGLDILMRAPATFSLTITPKSASLVGEGRVVMRTGSTLLDKKFDARTDNPLEVRMLLGAAQANLEQLCCSSQTGITIKENAIELSELTIPAFTANHVADHLTAMSALARRMADMPGAGKLIVMPLPPTVDSWTIRLALAFGLLGLVAVLFTQPFGRTTTSPEPTPTPEVTGVLPADAVHIQQLRGWRVAGPADFSSGAATRFLRSRNLALSGHVTADFSGQGGRSESAYLLVNADGRKRVCLLARGAVGYDAVFPSLDLLARIPKSSLPRIQWAVAPQFKPDGDALLVVQDAQDASAGLVLLRHGTQTYSARPADFNQIDLASQ